MKASVSVRVEGRMKTGDDPALPIEIAERDFSAQVLQSKQPVLVEFWAPWSPTCQDLDFVLKEVAAALAGKVKVIKVNVEDSPELSLWYDIELIPTLLCFVQGRLMVQIVGSASKQAILAKLKSFAAPA